MPLQCTGTNVVTAGNGRSLDPYTFMAWVNPPSITPQLQVVQKGIPGNNTRRIPLTSVAVSGFLTAVIDRATADLTYTTSSRALKANQWNFVAITFDSAAAAGTLVRHYIGWLDEPASLPTYSATTDGSGAFQSDAAQPIRFGNNAGGTTPCGLISTNHLVNRVLSLADIRAQQQQMRILPGITDGYWRIGSNGTGLVWDESGNNNHGTITGAIPTDDYLPRVGL